MALDFLPHWDMNPLVPAGSAEPLASRQNWTLRCVLSLRILALSSSSSSAGKSMYCHLVVLSLEAASFRSRCLLASFPAGSDCPAGRIDNLLASLVHPKQSDLLALCHEESDLDLPHRGLADPPSGRCGVWMPTHLDMYGFAVAHPCGCAGIRIVCRCLARMIFLLSRPIGPPIRMHNRSYTGSFG